MAQLDQLVIELRANITHLEAGISRAKAEVRSLGGRFDQEQKRIDQSFDSMGRSAKRLGGTLGAALSTKEIIDYSDTWKRLEGGLSIVSDTMSQVRQRQQELFDTAQRSRSPLEGTTLLYTKINSSLTDYQKTQFNTLRLTETFGKALAISGESAASAQAAILQFGQALGSNFQASGQEINSLIDQAPALARVVARELGQKTPAALKRMAEEGKLSTEIFLAAMSRAGAEIDRQFSKMPQTVGQAVTKLDNAFLRYIGNSEAVSTGTSSLALSLNRMAENFEVVADVALATGAVVGVRFAAQTISAARAAAVLTLAEYEQVAAMSAATAAAAANTRMAAGLAKAQQAAAGSTAAATVVVGSSGVAAVAATSRMAGLAVAAKGTGAAMLGAFGGPVGLVVTGALAAWALHTNQAEEA